jgi:hypothetical protein
MATFYLLPARAELARRWTAYFRQWLPSLPDASAETVEKVVQAVVRQPEVYVVFADDLPAGGDVTASLRDGFGADTGDRVIDVRGDAWADAA